MDDLQLPDSGKERRSATSNYSPCRRNNDTFYNAKTVRSPETEKKEERRPAKVADQ